MSIKIDPLKCIGCTKCTQVCPGTLIKMENKKAVIKYPKNFQIGVELVQKSFFTVKLQGWI